MSDWEKLQKMLEGRISEGPGSFDNHRKRWAAHKQGRPDGRFNYEMSPFHKKMSPPIQKLMDELAVELDKDRRNLRKPVIDAFVELAETLVWGGSK